MNTPAAVAVDGGNAPIRQEQIVVLPTLIKQLPLPLPRMIGDLSDEEQVLIGLGLVPEDLIDTDPAE